MVKSDYDLQLRSRFFANSRGEQFISAFIDNNFLLKKDLLNSGNYYTREGENSYRDGEVHCEIIDLVIDTAKKHAALDPSLRARALIGEFIKYIVGLPLNVQDLKGALDKGIDEFNKYLNYHIRKVIEYVLDDKKIKLLHGEELQKFFDETKVPAIFNYNDNVLYDEIIDILNENSLVPKLKNFLISHFEERLKINFYGKNYDFSKKQTSDLLENIYYKFNDLSPLVKNFYSKFTTVMEFKSGQWKEITRNLSRDDDGSKLRINLKNINAIPIFAYELPLIPRTFNAFHYTNNSGKVERVSMEMFTNEFKENLLFNLYLKTYVTMCQSIIEGETTYNINIVLNYDKNDPTKLYTLRTKRYDMNDTYDNSLQFSIMTGRLVADKLRDLSIDEEIRNKMKSRNLSDELVYDFYASNIFYRNRNGELVYRDRIGNVIELGNIANFIDNNCYLSELGNIEREKCDEFLSKCIFGKSDVSECTKYFKENNVELGQYSGVWHPQILMKLLDSYGFDKKTIDSPEHGCRIKVYQSVTEWLNNSVSDANITVLKKLMKANDDKANKLKQYFQSHVDKINNNPAILNDNIQFFKSQGQKCVSNQRNQWLENIGIDLRTEPAKVLNSKDFAIINSNKINVRNYGTVSPNLRGVGIIAQYGGANLIATSGYEFINEIFMKSLRKLESIGVSLDRNSKAQILSNLESLKRNESDLSKILSILDRYYEIYNAYGENIVQLVAGEIGYEGLEKFVDAAEVKLNQKSQYEKELSAQLNRLMKLQEKYKFNLTSPKQLAPQMSTPFALRPFLTI